MTKERTSITGLSEQMVGMNRNYGALVDSDIFKKQFAGEIFEIPDTSPEIRRFISQGDGTVSSLVLHAADKPKAHLRISPVDLSGDMHMSMDWNAGVTTLRLPNRGTRTITSFYSTHTDPLDVPGLDTRIVRQQLGQEYGAEELEMLGVELRDGVLRFLPGQGNMQQYLSIPFDHPDTRQTFADDFLIDERNGTMSFEYVDPSRGLSMPVSMPLFMVG